MSDTYNKIRKEAINFMEAALLDGRLSDTLVTYKVMKRFGFSRNWCEKHIEFLNEAEAEKEKLRTPPKNNEA